MSLTPIEEANLRILEEAPGIFVNYFLFHFSDVVKLVMCEQLKKDGRMIPRSCVMLTEQNADYLIGALQEWKRRKAEFAAQMNTMAGGAPEGGKLN